VEIGPGGDISVSAEIRKTVFVGEQGIPLEDEMDEYDAIAWHIVLCEDGVPVGSGRIYMEDGAAVLGRVAVLKEKRRQGYATMICRELIKVARREKATLVTLHSQSYAAELYDKLGFVRVGEAFLEEGIEHIRMDLILGK